MGRPREFSEDQALDAAMRVFWEKGYEGATLSDLTEAMGINRSSLYSSFGDKQLAYAAIQRTLAHYGANLSNVVMERIQTTDMDALIKSQDARKKIYGDWLPAATWIEVKRLYRTEARIEIDVEVRLDK